jgi:hypothetical protein
MSSLDGFVHARPFVERVPMYILSRQQHYGEISRELWEYIESTNCYRIPAGSYRVPMPPNSTLGWLKHYQTPLSIIKFKT